jgi:hypothetical protein
LGLRLWFWLRLWLRFWLEFLFSSRNGLCEGLVVDRNRKRNPDDRVDVIAGLWRRVEQPLRDRLPAPANLETNEVSPLRITHHDEPEPPIDFAAPAKLSHLYEEAVKVQTRRARLELEYVVQARQCRRRLGR